MKLFKKLNKLIKAYDENRLIDASLMIRTKKYQKEIDKFVQIDTKPSNEQLELMGLIISICRTIYERDYIRIPLTDHSYDKIIEKYGKYKQSYPYGKQVTGTSYDYPELTGNLHKCYYIYEDDKGEDDRPSFQWFFDKWSKTLGRSGLYPLMLSDKKDGISITITLKAINEKYMVVSKATTRGDKEKGMDVTHIFKGIKFIKAVDIDEFGMQLEFMIDEKSKKKFEKIKGREYKTMRSASVGLLAALQYCKNDELLSRYQSCMRLAMLNYDYDGLKAYSLGEHEQLNACIPDEYRLDLKTEIIFTPVSNGELFDILDSFITKRLEVRDALGYDIDGVVIRLLNPTAVRKLGRKNSTNEFQVAYKFPEMEKKTYVKGLIVDRGNFNYISLLADVEPVILNGTTQPKGQIHSLNKWEDMDLRVGDEVWLKHSGDVIPYMFVKSDRKRGTGPKLKLPTHCDECEEELVIENSMLRCKNPKCPGRILGKLITFIERTGMKSVKESKVKRLMEAGIDNPYDMIRVNKTLLASVGIDTKKTMDLILGEFDKIKHGAIYEYQLLASVGVDKLGRRASKTLLDAIPMKELLSLNEKELYNKILRVPGHKEAKAEGYSKGIYENRELLKDLLSVITLKPDEKTVEYSKQILVSGSRGDAEIIKKANSMGYGVRESGWKDVEILVVKDDSFRHKGKGKDALKKGIPIKTKSEFLKM